MKNKSKIFTLLFIGLNIVLSGCSPRVEVGMATGESFSSPENTTLRDSNTGNATGNINTSTTSTTSSSSAATSGTDTIMESTPAAKF